MDHFAWRCGTRAARGLILGALVMAAGCGGGQGPAKEPTAPTASDRTAAGLPTWLAGYWQDPDGTTEAWVTLGEVMVGVGMAAGGGTGIEPPRFEVMLLHREGDALVYTAMPGGTDSVDFTAVERGADAIGFENPAHDHPRRIDYRRDGDRLEVKLTGTEPAQQFAMTLGASPAADALMVADREFAAASRDRGGAAWAERFATAGASWPRGSERLVGPDAVAAMVDGLTAQGVALHWAPRAAGLDAGGQVGFTAGRYQLVRTGDASEPIAGSGIYVTVWWRTEGGWKILFDTGLSTRPEPDRTAAHS